MKRLALLAAFALVVAASNAQNTDYGKLRLAFSQSYVNESSKNYSAAIKSLTDVYDTKSYEINLRLGWLFYENQQYAEAMSYYRKAMALLPYSVEAKLGYTYPLAAAGNWNEVEKTYQQILDIDPQNATVLYKLGYIYYNRKNYTNAIKYFEKLYNLYPFSYDGVLMLGYSKLMNGNKAEAALLFNKALLLYPTDESATKGLELSK
jgi:tetratricopeptide (TPR) repeat protein